MGFQGNTINVTVGGEELGEYLTMSSDGNMLAAGMITTFAQFSIECKSV